MTAAMYTAFTAVAVVVSLLTEGAGLAITLGLLLSLGTMLGLWIAQRWLN